MIELRASPDQVISPLPQVVRRDPRRLQSEACPVSNVEPQGCVSEAPLRGTDQNGHRVLKSESLGLEPTCSACKLARADALERCARLRRSLSNRTPADRQRVTPHGKAGRPIGRQPGETDSERRGSTQPGRGKWQV
jgi:hypothetical protein